MLDCTHIGLSTRRSLWSYHKVQVLIASAIRNRRAFMRRKTPGLILDVGCGPNMNVQNINLDHGWRPGIDVCCDIRRGLPFPDDYVGGIFTEHCIEHIQFDEALFLFHEFRRVMVPGAWVRIIVPDLEIYVDHYNAFRLRRELSMPYSEDDMRPDGIYSPAISVNRIFRAHGHQFMYDFATLNTMLEKTGFTAITKARFGNSRDSRLLLDTPCRQIESLYVEAQRSPGDLPCLVKQGST